MHFGLELSLQLIDSVNQDHSIIAPKQLGIAPAPIDIVSTPDGHKHGLDHELTDVLEAPVELFTIFVRAVLLGQAPKVDPEVFAVL